MDVMLSLAVVEIKAHVVINMTHVINNMVVNPSLGSICVSEISSQFICSDKNPNNIY
jgi:hypothetical protein